MSAVTVSSNKFLMLLLVLVSVVVDVTVDVTVGVGVSFAEFSPLSVFSFCCFCRYLQCFIAIEQLQNGEN